LKAVMVGFRSGAAVFMAMISKGWLPTEDASPASRPTGWVRFFLS